MTTLLLADVRLVGSDGSPVDLLLRDGRITEIGPSLAPDGGARVVSTGGRWAMPGLWDAHVHVSQWASARHRLDLAACRSLEECLAAVAEKLRDEPRAEEVIGGGVWHARWPQPPHAELLDAVTGDVPTVLVGGDVHSAWLNTAALRRYGLAPHHGLLRENEWFALMPRLGATDPAVLDGWVSDAGRAAAARGVVGVVDFEAGDNLTDWSRRFAGGFHTQRVRASVWPDHLSTAIARGLRTGDVVDPAGGLLTMGPLKIIGDGSLNTRTAFCHEAFPDGSHGGLNVAPDQLEALMRRAAAAGIDSAIHAIGDRANTVVLDAFDRVGARGSIEHAQLLTRADVARFAALGITASVQPEQAMDDRDVAEEQWAGRTGRAYPLADLVRSGARLAFGSDAPVAPLDPWFAISSAVTRSRDGRAPWHPEQAIGRGVALTSSWGGVARLARGGPADLVLLEDDPFAVVPEALRGTTVAATLVAGRFTHSTLTSD